MCKQTKSLHAFNDFNSQMHVHLRQRTQSMFTTGDLRLIHLQQETSFLRASGEQWMYYSQQKSSPRWTFALLQLCRALAEKCCAQSFHHRQSLALVPTPALNQVFLGMPSWDTSRGKMQGLGEKKNSFETRGSAPNRTARELQLFLSFWPPDVWSTSLSVFVFLGLTGLSSPESLACIWHKNEAGRHITFS